MIGLLVCPHEGDKAPVRGVTHVVLLCAPCLFSVAFTEVVIVADPTDPAWDDEQGDGQGTTWTVSGPLWHGRVTVNP